MKPRPNSSNLNETDFRHVQDVRQGTQLSATGSVPITGCFSRLTIVRGAARTGKTTLEQQIGQAFQKAGKKIVALAPTAEASRGVLREQAKFSDADTGAQLLREGATVLGGIAAAELLLLRPRD
jgi:hypothetical protein